ncbi:MAG: T9SS type A sorting domain-containing protein [Bacteroidia bacterium]
MKKIFPIVFLFVFTNCWGQYYDTSYVIATGNGACYSQVSGGLAGGDRNGNIFVSISQKGCTPCQPDFRLEKKGLPYNWSFGFHYGSYPTYVVFGDNSGNAYAFGRFNSSIEINGIYVPLPTDANNYALLKIDTIGQPLWAFVTSGNRISINSSGYSYVLNNDSIKQYSPDGLLVWARAGGGIKVIANDNFSYYIQNLTGIKKYKSNGNLAWQLNTTSEFQTNGNRCFVYNQNSIEEHNQANGNLIASYPNLANSILFFDSDDNYYERKDSFLIKYGSQYELWRTKLTGTIFGGLRLDKKDNIYFSCNYTTHKSENNSYVPVKLFVPPSTYYMPGALTGIQCPVSSVMVGKINQEHPFNPHITTNTINALCKESTTNIPFTLNQYHVSYTNGFIAELSDGNGSFANPLLIGTGIRSPIETNTPFFNITNGNYKIRVSANTPQITGSPSPVINQFVYPPQVDVVPSNQYLPSQTSCTPLVLAVKPAGNFTYSWFKNDYGMNGFYSIYGSNDSLTLSGAYGEDYFVIVTDTSTNCFNKIEMKDVYAGGIQWPINFYIPDTLCTNSGPFDLVSDYLNGVFSGNYIYNNRFYPDSAGAGSHPINLHITSAPPCYQTIDTTKNVYVKVCSNEIQTQNIFPNKNSYCTGDTITVNFLYNPVIFYPGNKFIVQLGYYSYYSNYFIVVAEVDSGISSPITCVIPEVYNNDQYRIRVISTSPVFEGSPNYEGNLKIGRPDDNFILKINGGTMNCGMENSLIKLEGVSYSSPVYVWHYNNQTMVDSVNINQPYYNYFPISYGSTFFAEQNGDYSVEIINIYGCKSYSDTAHIDNSLDIPQFLVTTSKEYVCPNDSFLITLNTDTSNAVQWSTFNGIFTPPDLYSFYGYHSMSYFQLKVTNPSGCYVDKNVYANNAYPSGVDLYVSYNLQSFCEGNNLRIYASPNEYEYHYQWYRNDSAISGETNYDYYVQDTSIYKVKMTNEYGCVSFSDTLKATFFERPSFDILADSIKACSGQTYSEIAVNLSGIFPIYIKVWKNGEFVSSHTIYFPDDTISFTHNEGAGWYLLYADNTNCSPGDSDSVYVSFRNLPPAVISPSGAFTICNKDSLTLNANTGAGLTYQWRRDGGNIYNEISSVHQAKNAGSYTCVVSDSYCSATSNVVTLAINSLPAASIYSFSATEFCEGNYAVLNVYAVGNRTYQWKKNNIDIPGATQTSYSAFESGSYQAKVTNTITGCSKTSAAIIITVYPLPDSIITPQGPTTFCTGGSVILKANDSTATDYQWSNNGINIMGATSSSYTATQSGNYVCLITGEHFCNIYSDAVSVTVNPLPNASITPNGSIIFCTGDSVILNAVVANNRNYQWKKNGVNISGATNSSYTVFTSGKYKVTVTNTLTGCSKTTAAVATVTVSCREITDEISSLQLQEDEDFDVTVHPNPSSGNFVFEIKNAPDGNISIEIFDVIGKIVLSQSIYNSTFIIHNSSLSPGIYSVVITAGENKKAIRIIKTD